MATDLYRQDISLNAGADLSAKQYHILICDANKTANISGAAAANAVGVLQNKPAAAGRAAKVRVSGITKVKLGATVSSTMTPLCADSAGKAVTATSTQRYVCRNLETGVANDLVSAVMEFGKV